MRRASDARGSDAARSRRAPLRLLARGGGRQLRALRCQYLRQRFTRETVEPFRLAKLVLNACILEAGLPPGCNTETRLGTVCLRFGDEPLARHETSDEVPNRAVASTLRSMGVFVGAGPGEQTVGQAGIEAFHGSGEWVAQGTSVLMLPHRDEQRQDEGGENSTNNHYADATSGRSVHMQDFRRALGRRERTDRDVIPVRISERELPRSSVRVHVGFLFEPSGESPGPS